MIYVDKGMVRVNEFWSCKCPNKKIHLRKKTEGKFNTCRVCGANEVGARDSLLTDIIKERGVEGIENQIVTDPYLTHKLFDQKFINRLIKIIITCKELDECKEFPLLSDFFQGLLIQLYAYGSLLNQLHRPKKEKRTKNEELELPKIPIKT